MESEKRATQHARVWALHSHTETNRPPHKAEEPPKATHGARLLRERFETGRICGSCSAWLLQSVCAAVVCSQTQGVRPNRSPKHSNKRAMGLPLAYTGRTSQPRAPVAHKGATGVTSTMRAAGRRTAGRSLNHDSICAQTSPWTQAKSNGCRTVAREPGTSGRECQRARREYHLFTKQKQCGKPPSCPMRRHSHRAPSSSCSQTSNTNR